MAADGSECVPYVTAARALQQLSVSAAGGPHLWRWSNRLQSCATCQCLAFLRRQDGHRQCPLQFRFKTLQRAVATFRLHVTKPAASPTRLTLNNCCATSLAMCTIPTCLLPHPLAYCHAASSPSKTASGATLSASLEMPLELHQPLALLSSSRRQEEYLASRPEPRDGAPQLRRSAKLLTVSAYPSSALPTSSKQISRQPTPSQPHALPSVFAKLVCSRSARLA